MSDISTVHPQYAKAAPRWEKASAVLSAEGVENYLVKLNPNDLTKENNTRNDQYKERSVFFRIAGQTVSGMTGTIFRKSPKIDLPDDMQYMLANADGAGVSITQQAQSVCDDLLGKGRAGLMVSFPVTAGQVSRAQIMSGEIVPTIHAVWPENIVNWATRRIGSKTVLSMVVIAESDDTANGYAIESTPVLRERILDAEGVYRERIHRKINGAWIADAWLTPLDADGNPWKEIPFTFVGAMNNDAHIDAAPADAIIDLNIAHYRNSADYEDTIWFAGQVQAWMSGITQDHVNLMKKEGMYIGSRTMIGVPSGETFGFAQAEPNIAVRQAMLDKVEMMQALGARLIMPGSANKTATQAAGEIEIQHSVISLVATNCSAAYSQSLRWACRFIGADESKVSFALNTDYSDVLSNPQELQQIIAGFIQGAVPLADYTRYMRRLGLFDPAKSDEDYADDLARNTGG